MATFHLIVALIDAKISLDKLPYFTDGQTDRQTDEPVGRVFPRYFEFFQTFTSVSVTYANTGKNKITRRKL